MQQIVGQFLFCYFFKEFLSPACPVRKELLYSYVWPMKYHFLCFSLLLCRRKFSVRAFSADLVKYNCTSVQYIGKLLFFNCLNILTP